MATSTTFTVSPLPDGYRFTVTVTAADGSVPAGVPLSFSFGSPGAMSTVNSGAVTDSNGQYTQGWGFGAYPLDFSYATSATDVYAASMSNTVHLPASVTSSLFALTGLSGTTLSGTVWAPQRTQKPGVTVTLYSVASDGTRTQVANRVSDLAGGWSVSLRPETTATSYLADITNTADYAGSASRSIHIPVATRTTLIPTPAGARIDLRGTVADAYGTGQHGVLVRLSSLTKTTRITRTLATLRTRPDGTFAVTAPACSVVCTYYAIVAGDTDHGLSSAVTSDVKPATALAIREGARSKHTLSVALSLAVSHQALAGRKVTIYSRPASSRSWTKRATITTDRTGRGVYVAHPAASTYYRAGFVGSGVLASSVSARMHLTR